MIVFWFYLTALLLIFTVAAALADWLGHEFPDFLDPDSQASADRRSREAETPTKGTGS